MKLERRARMISYDSLGEVSILDETLLELVGGGAGSAALAASTTNYVCASNLPCARINNVCQSNVVCDK